MSSNSSETDDQKSGFRENHRRVDPEPDHAVGAESTRASEGLPGVAGNVGRGLGGLVEGIGGLFAGLARAGLEAAEGTGEGREDRTADSDEEPSADADRRHDGGDVGDER